MVYKSYAFLLEKVFTELNRTFFDHLGSVFEFHLGLPPYFPPLIWFIPLALGNPVNFFAYPYIFVAKFFDRKYPLFWFPAQTISFILSQYSKY